MNAELALYIGVTKNLERRVHEHKVKANKGFTNDYNCDILVYYEEYSHIRVAIAREKPPSEYHFRPISLYSPFFLTFIKIFGIELPSMLLYGTSSDDKFKFGHARSN